MIYVKSTQMGLLSSFCDKIWTCCRKFLQSHPDQDLNLDPPYIHCRYGCFTLSYLDLKLTRKSTTVICISMISKRFMSTLMNLESEEFLGNTERTTILLKIYFMSFWCLKSINVECGFTFKKSLFFIILQRILKHSVILS